MSWQYPKWTMQQARALGFAAWDLYDTNWGYSTNVLFPDSTVDPAGTSLESAFGVVVGPRSTVDRVFLSFTIPSPIANSGLVTLWNDGRRILDMTQLGTRMPLALPAAGPLAVSPAVYFPTSYYPDGGALTAITNADFEAPGLHLQFLLRPLTQALIPMVRAPMLRQYSDAAAGAGAEALLAGYPVAARSKATLHFRVTAGTVSFRVGGVSVYAGLNATGYGIEKTIGSAAAVTGTTAASVVVNLSYEYLTLYATVSAGPAAFQVDLRIDD